MSQATSTSSTVAVPTSDSARQRRKIADLEEKLQVLESGQALKKREINYIMSQGRAIRRTVSLFDSIEELIGENDRRCDNDDDNDNDMTVDQDRLQSGYIALNNALPWFHQKASDMEHDDYINMLKKLRQGADGARGDDTSKLKSLVPDWVNREFKPNPPVDPEDKFCRGFANDACGKLLCPTELDWNDPTSFLSGLQSNLYIPFLRKGSSQVMVMVPTLSKTTDARKRILPGRKSKHMWCKLSRCTKSQPARSRMYRANCDSHYHFFERPPGRVARRNVDQLLAWWTRKVFGTSQRAELSDAARAKMSVNALAMQRAQLDDAQFDSE
ncbi:hypothetical protein EDD22DRAFT_847107 [Suillus occidentalis]|nr:hypothetical protein EDD22DRAFT_847107 [Suillus occidentalis]